MKILLIGPQGSGKGTIGEKLTDLTGLPIVSSGQTLREIPEGHRWYEEVNDQMNKGILVDQEKVASLLREKLSSDKYKNGFILDGWFRSMKDVRLFDPDFDKAVYLNIPREESIDRLTSRRTCKECGDIYNVHSNPPRQEGVCDECGGELYQRDDDTPEAINKRLNTFESETTPVISMLKEKGILQEVNGVGTYEEVFERVKNALGI